MLVLKDLASIAEKEDGLAPRDFVIEFERFSEENGLLTPTLKLSRASLYSHYKVKFQELFEKLETSEDQVKQILNSVLSMDHSAGDLDFSKAFRELGGDSLELIRFQSLVREHLGVDIPNHLLSNTVSIQEMVDYLKQEKEKRNVGSRNTESFASDKDAAFSDLTLRPKSREITSIESDTSNGEPTILLTGATGFLGSQLLMELLNTYPNGVIYCLVNAQSDEIAYQRLLQQCKDYLLVPTDQDIIGERVRVLAGNLSYDQFGLHSELYNKLCSTINLVFHCGAWVNWIADYRTVRPANVLGTLTILDLVIHGCKKQLHYISTISVASEPEETASISLDHLRALLKSKSGYGASKLVAEKLVRDVCSENGVDFIIYRPGMITGHSVSGAANPSDYVNRLLCGIVWMKFFIQEPSTYLDMTPVNIMAHAIVHISRSGNAINKTFHLVNPNPFSYQKIGEAVKLYVESVNNKENITPLSYKQWRSELIRSIQSSPKDHPLAPLQNFFPDSLMEIGNYSTSNAAGLGLGFFCKEQENGMTAEVIGKYLAYLQSVNVVQL